MARRALVIVVALAAAAAPAQAAEVAVESRAASSSVNGVGGYSGSGPVDESTRRTSVQQAAPGDPLEPFSADSAVANSGSQGDAAFSFNLSGTTDSDVDRDGDALMFSSSASVSEELTIASGGRAMGDGQMTRAELVFVVPGTEPVPYTTTGSLNRNFTFGPVTGGCGINSWVQLRNLATNQDVFYEQSSTDALFKGTIPVNKSGTLQPGRYRISGDAFFTGNIVSGTGSIVCTAGYEFDFQVGSAPVVCTDPSQGVMVGYARACGPTLNPVSAGSKLYSTPDVAWVGGFEIHPKPGGKLIVDTELKELRQEGAGAEVYFRGVPTSLPVSAIPVILPSASIDLTNSAGTLQNALFKLPLGGALEVAWGTDPSTSTIKAAVKVAEGLIKPTMGTLFGGDLEAKFEAAQANGTGLKLTSAEVKLPSLQLEMAGADYATLPTGGVSKVGLAGGTLKYEDVGGLARFTGSMGFTLPAASPTQQLTVTPTIIVLDGSLSGLGLKVAGINRPLGTTGLFLQSVDGLGVWNPRFGLDLGATATLGPKLPVSEKALLALEARLRVLDLVQSCPKPQTWAELILSSNIPTLEDGGYGKAKVDGTACMIAATNPAFQMSGNIEFTATMAAEEEGAEAQEIASAKGALVGWVNDNGAQMKVDGTLSMPAVPTISATGLVSTVGYAFCAGFGFFQGGFGASWTGYSSMFSGCDLMPWEVSATPSRAVAAATGGVRVPDGLPFVGFAADGRDGAPVVRLRAPNGASTTVGQRLVKGRDMVVVPVAALRRTFVFVRKPRGGTWRVTGDDVSRIEMARGLPAPRIRARVRRRGAKRVLRYRIRPLPGQTVQFFERTRGGVRPLGKATRKRRGTISFRPIAAPDRRHRIEAQVVQNRLPRRLVRVATFTLAKPKKPAKVTKLRVARAAGAITARWARSRRATGYDAELRDAAGNLLARLAVTKRQVSFPQAPAGVLEVRITPTVRFGPSGATASARTAAR